jgi:hypothetical protein
MAVNIHISVASAIGCMEQVSFGCQADQNVGLLRRTRLPVTCLVPEKLVELGHAAASLLQLCPQGLKGGALAFLEISELFKNLWRKWRAWVRGSPFDEVIEWITDFLRVVKRCTDRIFMLKRIIERVHYLPPSSPCTQQHVVKIHSFRRAMRTWRPARFQRSATATNLATAERFGAAAASGVSSVATFFAGTITPPRSSICEMQ